MNTTYPHRVRIRLDTTTDVQKFTQITAALDGVIVVKDPNGLCVNAKSVIGNLHAMEFSELWCESENDIYMSIRDFVVI